MNLFFNKLTILLFLFGSFLINAQESSFMTFNIRYDNPDDNENAWSKRKEEVVNLIQFYHPDFVGIQEGLEHQVAYIQEQLSDYKYIGVGRDDGAKKGEYSAIYYDIAKYELISEETFWLSKTPEKVSVGWDASMERICTYGKFKNRMNQKISYVFNAHFDHIGKEAREKSAELILKKINELDLTDERVVVMGDFNAIPSSKPVKVFKKELEYGFEVSINKPYGPDGTYNDFKNSIVVENRLDYIFTKNLKVTKYRHIDDKRKNNLCVSDHFPVLITVE